MCGKHVTRGNTYHCDSGDGTELDGRMILSCTSVVYLTCTSGCVNEPRNEQQVCTETTAILVRNVLSFLAGPA